MNQPTLRHHGKFYIDGEWVEPTSPGATFSLVNPATEQVFATVALGSEQDVDRAVSAARGAFPQFSVTPKAERIGLLRRIVELMHLREGDLMAAASEEMGTPLSAVGHARGAADPNFRKLHVPDRLVELGRKGQKTRAGWYRYDEGDRTPHPDPEVKRIVAEVAGELGPPQRTFTDEEILKRLLFASVNEACKILEDGKAYRGSDIDVMWLHGFGFPRHRGGVMFWADGIGAREIHRQVVQWHKQHGGRSKPGNLLAAVAERGGLLREATSQPQ